MTTVLLLTEAPDQVDFFSGALTQSLLCQVTSQESYLQVTWICLLLLQSFGMWEAPLEGSNIEIQVPPNSLNISPDDGLREYNI